MAYTKHGHHMPGTSLDGRPRQVARCGGIALCRECNTDAYLLMKASLTAAPIFDTIDHRQPNFD